MNRTIDITDRDRLFLEWERSTSGTQTKTTQTANVCVAGNRPENGRLRFPIPYSLFPIPY